MRERPYPVAAGAESTREKRSECVCDSAPCRLSVFSVCVRTMIDGWCLLAEYE